MNEPFELEFQLLTPGLYSGDKVNIRINYVIQSSSFWSYLPWTILIEGELDGLVCRAMDTAVGHNAYRDNVEIPFVGNMPSGKSLKGKLTFKVAMPYHPDPGMHPFRVVGEKAITIPNLDDVPPPDGDGDGEPPAVCTEGQEKCVGYTLYICLNNQWKVKEYNSPKCGYTPPPICTDGEEVCSGYNLLVCSGGQWVLKESNSAKCGYVPPDGEPPPEDGGVPGWFERNKTVIIVVSAVVLAIVLTVLAIKKLKFQTPILRK